MKSLKNRARSNKLNVWFILSGVGLAFVVFYYFLGKKFGLREGAESNKKGGKISFDSSVVVDKINNDKILKDLKNVSKKTKMNRNGKPSQFATNKEFGKHIGNLAILAEDHDDRLVKIEDFLDEIAKSIVDDMNK
jgi:hypothetical protein